MQNEDSEKLVHFSQLIVVPPHEILEYRKTLEEKEERKKKERELKQELKDNPIMPYTIPQLRNVLVTKLKVPLSSKQKTKLELVRLCYVFIYYILRLMQILYKTDHFLTHQSE